MNAAYMNGTLDLESCPTGERAGDKRKQETKSNDHCQSKEEPRIN